MAQKLTRRTRLTVKMMISKVMKLKLLDCMTKKHAKEPDMGSKQNKKIKQVLLGRHGDDDDSGRDDGVPEPVIGGVKASTGSLMK